MEENTSKVYLEPADALLSQASGAGSPLFVINLCASMAPATLNGKSLPGLDSYRLYQVSRVEDGRTRYRLRLGFFPTQDAANRVLETVRQQYPTAFTASLSDEDRRFTRGYVVDTSATGRMRVRPAVSVVPPAPPPVAAAKQAAPQLAARVAPSAPAKPAPIAQTKVAAPAPATKAASPAAPAAKTAAPAAAPPAKWEPQRAAASSAKTGATGSYKALDQRAVTTGSFKALDKAAATGTFRTLEQKAVATGMHKALEQKAAATGSHKALEQKAAATGSHRALEHKAAATGSFKALDQSAINEIEISWNKPAATKAAPPAATKPAAAKAAPPPAVKAPAAKAPAKVPELKNPPVTVKPSAPMKLELEAAPAPAPRQAAPAVPNNQPFHVGKGVNIPQVSLSLETGKHSSFKPAAAPAAAKSPAAPANKAAAPSKPAAQQPATSSPLPARMTGLPDLDSTQTIRALTDEEMNDAQQEKWWAIQLAVSEQPVNLDAMPHLDIFEAYRLYSVAGASNGKILHSLRLGFFREAVSAEAVSGYLKTFFPTPAVLRISTAEQVRFKDAPAPKTAPKAESKVIDLNDARDRAKPAVPVVTMEVADRSPTGTFKPGAVAFKNGTSGTYKTPAAKPAAAKPAVARRSAAGKPAHMQTGKFRAPAKSSLQEQLLEAAREVELSESGIRRLPKNDSLLSRLVDRLKK